MRGPFIKQKGLLLAAAVFIIAVAALAVYSLVFQRHDPNLTNLGGRLQGLSPSHLLGTDHLGRDVLTRLLLGGGVTIGYSLLALSIAIFLGTAAGMLTGYFGGWIDRVFMRVGDGFLAFPDMVAAIVLSGLLGPGIGSLVFAIVAIKWVAYARVVRSIVLSERHKDYVMAAKASGLSPAKVLRKHLLPHIAGQLLVLSSLDLGKVILLITALSYIGLGAQPPTPEWGSMLNDSRPYFQAMPELIVYPGLAIVAVVLIANIAGDVARDYFDKRKETSL